MLVIALNVQILRMEIVIYVHLTNINSLVTNFVIQIAHRLIMRII
jgi:hypothetical protein